MSCWQASFLPVDQTPVQSPRWMPRLLTFPSSDSQVKWEPALLIKTDFILKKVCASHLPWHFFKFQVSAAETVLVQEVSASQGQILLPPWVWSCTNVHLSAFVVLGLSRALFLVPEILLRLCLLVITTWSFEQDPLSARVPVMKSCLLATPGTNHAQLHGNYLTRVLNHACSFTSFSPNTCKKGSQSWQVPTLYCQLTLAPNPIMSLASAAGLENVDSPRKYICPSDFRISQALRIKQRRGEKIRPLQKLTKENVPRDNWWGKTSLPLPFIVRWLHSSNRISCRISVSIKYPFCSRSTSEFLFLCNEG